MTVITRDFNSYVLEQDKNRSTKYFIIIFES